MTAVCPPADATYVLDEFTAATKALSAAAAASLGELQPALDLGTAITTTNPYVGADMALTKGWCLRELGNEEAAKTAFRAATVHGVALEAAREALDDPTYRLVITDAETIASRTDPWEALHRLPHHDVQMGCGTAATDDRVAT